MINVQEKHNGPNNGSIGNAVKKPQNNTTNESLAQLDTFSCTKPINPRDIYRLDSTDKTVIKD
jgi:hypothetical protein